MPVETAEDAKNAEMCR